MFLGAECPDYHDCYYLSGMAKQMLDEELEAIRKSKKEEQSQVSMRARSAFFILCLNSFLLSFLLPEACHRRSTA